MQNSTPEGFNRESVHQISKNPHISKAPELSPNNNDGDGHVGLLQPHSLLPMPVPPGTSNSNPQNDDDVSSSFSVVWNFIRQRSNDLSSAIARRISSFRQSMEDDEDENDESLRKKKILEVTEFNLSGLKVVVKLKPEEKEEEIQPVMKGRISFFSRSNCRDCTAVRRFFREKGLRLVEINIDVCVEFCIFAKPSLQNTNFLIGPVTWIQLN